MADFVEGEDMTLKKNHPAGYNGITDGVIWQQLLLFFFPILFGTFFQQLYNTADAVIVGNFVGKGALAAVGATAVVLNLLVAAMMGVIIPMVMVKLGRDPAVGSSVMITAITDTGGFFIFLGLATLFLM